MADAQENRGRSKRSKRIITDARKEQNRVASRAYRQRRKERAQSSQYQSQARLGRHRVLQPRQPLVVDQPGQQQAMTSIHLESIAPSRDSLETMISDRMLQPVSSGGEKPSNELISLPASIAPFPSGTGSNLTGDPPAFDAIFSQMSLLESNLNGDPGTVAILSTQSSPLCHQGDEGNLTMLDAWNSEMTLRSPAANSHVSNYQSPKQIPVAQSNLPPQNPVFHPPNSRSPRSQSRILEDFDTQIPPLDGPVDLNLGLANTFSGGLDLAFGDPATPRSWGLPMPLSLPSPYRTSIQPSHTPTLRALLRNARCLGINIEDLMTTCLKYGSPFYRSTTIADDPKTLLATSAITSLPAHLQPTLPQILFPHPAYLDLVPFPVIRARAVSWAASSSPLFNLQELKMDMMGGGLICWRAEIGDDRPPDLQTWEAAPWFKRKWRMLVDGGTTGV